MRTLYVAAGGGGDAVGVLLARRLLDPKASDPPLVSTCAWERLGVDPVPGPRARHEFVGLGTVGNVSAEILGSSDTRPPGRSMLPRLAAETPARIFLHDFERGAVGLAHQLSQLADSLDADSFTVLDVGGDVVARGDEHSLLSPLADSLTLAACIRTSIPTRVAVLGPGVDAELSAEAVRTRLEALEAARIGTIAADDVLALEHVLSWHPTEATTLVAASGLGIRGRVDMRRGLDPVPLTEQSADLWVADRLEPETLPLAYALTETASLDQAEEVMRRIAVDELDYERERAVRMRKHQAPSFERLDRFARLRMDAGATHVTKRRLRESAIGDPDLVPGARIARLGLWSLETLASRGTTRVSTPGPLPG